jgi:hypothetical protein
LYFQFHTVDGPFGGIEVPPGTVHLAIQLPPGPAFVRCSDGDGAVSDEVPIDVLESETAFEPFYLSCEGKEQTLTPSVVMWKSVPPNLPDPVETVRSVATGLRESDLLEVGGYSQSPLPLVRLVRSGEVIAVFELVADGPGWTVYFSACADSRVGVVGTLD